MPQINKAVKDLCVSKGKRRIFRKSTAEEKKELYNNKKAIYNYGYPCTLDKDGVRIIRKPIKEDWMY